MDDRERAMVREMYELHKEAIIALRRANEALQQLHETIGKLMQLRKNDDTP
jgi:hypothetical protein